jgi:hypothetical protein
MARNPSGINISGVDKVEAGIHKSIQQTKGGGFVCSPSKNVPSKCERSDFKA